MELAKRQSVLARLLTELELRESFLDSPADAAESLGITVEQSEELAASVRGLPELARSLVGKRLGVVERLLPWTAQLAGERFSEEFRSYACVTPSAGLWRHERDALALARRLQTELDGAALDALLYESAWVEARMGRRMIVRGIGPGSYGVWIRLRGKVRHWRFGAGLGWAERSPDAQESK